MTARFFSYQNEIEYPWLKNRGYPHLTPQLNLVDDKSKIISLLHNKNYISRYAFFPLIHSVINERRYKKIGIENNERAHSFVAEDGSVKKNIKSRPLHYATHFDAIIFGYYADILLKKYEVELLKHTGLQECITAYRRIPIETTDKNKSTIHFASEAFKEIENRANGECEVLKFDIKSFFSRINHELLKTAWAKLLDKTDLPDDHYNVFKAATRFSYVLKDDLRLKNYSSRKRLGFDEKKLAQIRKKGKICFFESTKEFRDKVKEGVLKIHQFPFKDKEGVPVGIPQGLPISAVLANCYLLNFDLDILNELVNKLGVFYRRYSDDIIVVCHPNQANYVEEFINNTIKKSKVEMSVDKTERFLFVKSHQQGRTNLTAIQITKTGRRPGIPFTYLGFEFYGDKTLIKSANLAKFYRRMIRAVKTKSRRALQVNEQTPFKPLVIHRKQLYRLYTQYPLSSTSLNSNYKRLVKNDKGDFFYHVTKRKKANNSNYLSYVHRASEVMNESALKLQIRNHSKIFNQAINKHLKKIKELK
jgi:hypothetical protein